MAAPLIPLAELQSLTASLLACGARIDEINTLRRHLDSLKGGGLAQATNGARIVSLILSDVVSDPLEAIASGPTAPDPSTREDAISIIGKYSLKTGIIPFFRETAKSDNPVFERVQNRIIASNDIALRAALEQAQQEGFQAEVVRSGMQGQAKDAGRELAEALKSAESRLPRPFWLLAGGETTVTLRGTGRGGRNQELALGAVESLRGLDDMMLISIATDGEDGPTDAAGAVATGESARRAELLGMAAPDYLSRNDAYTFFARLDDLVKTGPSGTNVNDLVFLFAF
jgi:hydroxypyruvate reductase